MNHKSWAWYLLIQNWWWHTSSNNLGSATLRDGNNFLNQSRMKGDTTASPGSSSSRPLIRRSNNDTQDNCLLEGCEETTQMDSAGTTQRNEPSASEKVGVIINVKPFNPRKISLWGGSKKDRISLGMNSWLYSPLFLATRRNKRDQVQLDLSYFRIL